MVNIVNKALEIAQENDLRVCNLEHMQNLLGSKAAARARNDIPPHTAYQEIVEKLKPEQKNSLSEEDYYAISQQLALESMVINAARSGINAQAIKQPEEQIREFLDDYLKVHNHNEAVAVLGQKLNSMIISLVHTMHPTIYHSTEARVMERRLTKLFENIYEDENGTNAPAASPFVKKQGEQLILTQEGQERMRALLQPFVRGLKDRTLHMTPYQQITVGEETRTEEENLRYIREELGGIVQAWNKALAQLHDQGKLTEHDINRLTIDKDQEARIFELRTWGRSADADGREKATSQYLYQCVYDACDNAGAYHGPIMDLRQNAEVHRDFMSSLIQVKHRNSDIKRSGNGHRMYGEYGEEKGAFNHEAFEVFCDHFMKARERRYIENNWPWDGTDKSIFQQLHAPKYHEQNPNPDFDDRFAFMQALLTEGYHLVPGQVRRDVEEFNKKVYDLRKKFFEENSSHSESIRIRGFDPKTISYDQMVRVSVPFSPTDDTAVNLRAKWKENIRKKTGFELLQGGLQYNRLHAEEPQQMLAASFLEGARKLKNGRQIDLDTQDRATFMDTIKRMMVIDMAIESTKGKGGNPVATRYQMANFSQPSDFLITLKLFEEAGLAEIDRSTKKAVVKNVKLGIMPLLETREDMDAAVDIFKKILSSDIARSYYEARGRALGKDQPVAEIMLGFSDGSMTNGNFASEWKIYQTARQLQTLFAEHGIKVRFLQGRGRGVDRGGTIDPSLQFNLMPPEIYKDAVYDVTIQSDLPMDLAASPAYGRDYLTKIFLGTLGASLKPEQGRSPEEEHKKEIEGIATRASQIYNDLVRTNADALSFLKAMPNNPYKSSRKPARKQEEERSKAKNAEEKRQAVCEAFDKQRAITKEYGSVGGADLNLNNVGLGVALAEFEKEYGQNRVESLRKQSPFFRAILQKIAAGMAHYDPYVANHCAKLTNTEDFVSRAHSDLSILHHKLKNYGYVLGSKDPGAIAASAHDVIAHAMINTGIERNGGETHPNVQNPSQKRWAEILYNLLFTTAQEVGHRQLPKEPGLSTGRSAS